jgi:hypothetical protein
MNVRASGCDKGWFRNVRCAVSGPALVDWRYGMILKSGNRFSDKIMLNQELVRDHAPGSSKGIAR